MTPEDLVERRTSSEQSHRDDDLQGSCPPTEEDKIEPPMSSYGEEHRSDIHGGVPSMIWEDPQRRTNDLQRTLSVKNVTQPFTEEYDGQYRGALSTHRGGQRPLNPRLVQ